MTNEEKKILRVFYGNDFDIYLTTAESFSYRDLIRIDTDYQIVREISHCPSFKDWVESNYELNEVSSALIIFYEVVKGTLFNIYMDDNNINVIPSDDKLKQSILLESLPEEDRLFTHLPPIDPEFLEYVKNEYGEFYDYFTNKETRERYKQYIIDKIVEGVKKRNIQ